jgi:trans-2,3-dihydro-3-hydroxyanthranilate isomerase
MQLRFVTVDVFTSDRFSGNPLAVVLNAEGLTTEQMQAVAAEFNLSETTFVLPPKDDANTAQVRIFTPRYEMPFAGHPNVGTAFVLAREGTIYGRAVDEERVVFEEKAGLVPVEILKDGGVVTGARLESPQPFTRGADVLASLIADACGLLEDDIMAHHHAPCVASCGTPFILAAVRSRSVLAGASPRSEVFERRVAKFKAFSILIYTRDGKAGIDLRARMFAPHIGVPEDPATGSAAVALIGLLADLHPETDVVLDSRIAQGVEMGRPSLLDARAIKRGGKVHATYIGGHCVPVMSGAIEVA